MSTNHLNNLFTNGVNVLGGLNTDSLIVNGVSISSGGASGVSIATNINDNSATNVPCTQLTYQLNQKNTNQDNTLNSHDSTLTTHTSSIASLNAAMDALYGGTALGWVGVTGANFLLNSGAMSKTGGTFTGDVACGVNNITSVKDVKFSNALIAVTTTANVYCSNLIASNITGDGSKITNLDLSLSTNLGTGTGSGITTIGRSAVATRLLGFISTDLTFDSGLTRSINNAKDVYFANAIIGTTTANVYCGNVVCSTGAYYYGDGSKLTGIASSADATNSLNFATVPTTGTVNLGTAMTSGVIKIGNASTSGPQVAVVGGASGLSLLSGGAGLSLNSSGAITIGTATNTTIQLGYNGGTPTNPINMYASTLTASILHAINPTATHTALTTGFIQTCVVPLSSEQGPISTSIGTGVLPTVMFRVPFQWKIYGVRMHCLGASSSAGVSVDIRYFSQSTSISTATVNSTQGTSIFTTTPGTINIDVLKYTSVGSTNVSQNGVLSSTPPNPVTVPDDSILGFFIKTAGTGVLGLKATVYYTL